MPVELSAPSGIRGATSLYRRSGSIDKWHNPGDSANNSLEQITETAGSRSTRALGSPAPKSMHLGVPIQKDFLHELIHQ